MYNVGIIGLGGMGQKMLADMAVHSSFTVTTIWDPDPDSAAASAVIAKHPSMNISANADELIADPVLILCTLPVRRSRIVDIS